MSSGGMMYSLFSWSELVHAKKISSRSVVAGKCGGEVMLNCWCEERRSFIAFILFPHPSSIERHEVKINGMCNFLIPRTIRIPFWTFNGLLPINSVEYLLWDIFTSPPTVFALYGSHQESLFRNKHIHKYTIEQKALSIFRHRKKKKMFLIMSE